MTLRSLLQTGFPRTCGGDPLRAGLNRDVCTVFPAPAGVILNGDKITVYGSEFSPHLRG